VFQGGVSGKKNPAKRQGKGCSEVPFPKATATYRMSVNR
jgi:hypothetical protein